LDNAERFGGDAARIIVAGESAGGNLATSLALVSCLERPEEWARAVYRRNEPPAGVVAACGLLEVENPHRFHELAERSWMVTKQTIEHIARSYLPHHPRHAGEHDLANPLRLLESAQPLSRPLPPFFLACGTKDPLLHDTQRLERALQRRHVEHEARYYDGEIHAFHAMWWRAQSRALWEDTRRYMLRQLDARGTLPEAEIAA
jgi:acetyl esterase